MADCKPCTTPVDLQAKLAGDSGPPVEDASQFRSIAGALQYLTFTRSDIAYAVQQICLHMHDPREPHLTAMKRILRYLQGTPDYGLLLCRRLGGESAREPAGLWYRSVARRVLLLIRLGKDYGVVQSLRLLQRHIRL
jgi:hypothetical protein